MIRSIRYSGDWSDAALLAECLHRAGLGEAAARRRAESFSRVAAALARDAPRAEPWHGLVVPGRIEVLGKHTDYAGGRTMVVAAEQGFALLVRPRTDPRVRVIDAGWGQEVAFALDAELVPRRGHWSNYPMTVARRLARNFALPLVGADIALASDLPPAAGMSSSSALVVAIFLALAEVNRLADRPEFRASIRSLTDLAGYLATVENGQTFGTLSGDRGVGTFGGSEDHTAILCAQPGHLSQYRYCPVRLEQLIPMPKEHVFAVAVSGVVAEKTGAAMERYNAASRRVGQIVQAWRAATGRNDVYLADILAQGLQARSQLESILRGSAYPDASAEALLARLHHFLIENEELQPAAAEALRRGDLAEFGRLVDASQEAAERLLGNQVPETVVLARTARQLGAAAASAFGAGFGGGVWALVHRDHLKPFVRAWGDAYLSQFPQHAQRAAFLVTEAGPPAFRLTP